MLLFGAVTRGQWFSDGNKRTALMVANHQLIHDGIGVFSIPPEDKAQFVSMLLRYYETGDYSRLSDLALTERRRPCARRADFGPIVWGRGKDE